GYVSHYPINVSQIKEAAKLINQSKRPVMYVGGGAIASGAHEEIKKLSEKTGAPVTCTLMGLGAFPSSHKNSLGMLGMHGTAWANHSMQNADLLIALGARFDDRVTGRLESFAKHAKIIHVDID
ncbi:MAG: acetolactate synthase catalytic subunit, partial [Phototrophicales bacterium]